MAIKLNQANIVSVGSVVIFLLTPFVTTSALGKLIDSILGRLVLIGFLLYAITLGPLPGVLAFLAVASLFAERNRIRIQEAKKYIIAKGSPPTLGQMNPHSEPAPVGEPIKDTPWIQYSHNDSFFDDSGNWNDLPQGQSEDEKQVLASELYPNDRQNAFYIKAGLAPAEPNA
jgi:hypothetical protein